MPTILAVDPGAASGWALLEPTEAITYRLVAYGLARPTTADRCRRVVISAIHRAAMAQRAGVGGARVAMVLEDQYLPPGSYSGNGSGPAAPRPRVRGENLIALVVNRARWQVIAELEHVSVDLELVRAHSWQSRLLLAARGVTRPARKRMAVACVTATWPGIRVTQDEADALCIGIWAAMARHVRVCRQSYPTARTRGE